MRHIIGQLRRLSPIALAALALATPARAASFVNFESGQVRPLALSPDATRLYAVNTPDGRLEVFDATGPTLVHTGSVTVGLEPVAVAARTDGEVWVVNHLSDSVSIVDVASVPPRVVRTLLVGDEPRDVVFAGPGRRRAFVTTAHRGQASPVDLAPFQPSIARADVWTFDAVAPGAPPAILTLFGDTPRALAVSPDGGTVYAAIFHSGNQTTSLSQVSTCVGDGITLCDGTMPANLPLPMTNFEGVPQPQVGLIVKLDPATGAWQDETGHDWRSAVRFSLPDLDVFTIDASATPPVVTGAIPHVGTILYDLAVNPATGALYVSNTEARNEARFSGPGIFAGHSVRGHLHEARITVVDGNGVTPRRLNPHIDYATVPSPPGVAERSLATPTGMAITADGATLYVAALGSSAVGVIDTAALAAGTFVPGAASRIAVTGGGPTGLALDESRSRLYVLTRFDDAVSVVDTASRTETVHLALHDPEPASVRNGRRYLYDATLTSSNGEASCAACHVFGDWDSLAWDLGNPDAPVVADPNPSRQLATALPPLHPMKGPMTTQTLRGIATLGPMHWRGDRTGAYAPGGDSSDERAAFEQFNEAFVSLLGRATPLDADEMDELTDFGLSITPPPNPIRALDGSLTPRQQEGHDAFARPDNCIACHVLDAANGFFGTDGVKAPNESNKTQIMKIPRLDVFYRKLGMFEMRPPFNYDDTSPVGDQTRGFGYIQDGSFGFPPSADPKLMEFLLVFDTVLAPIVGQQATLDVGNGPAIGGRLDLLVARAAAGECDLVVKGAGDGEERGWVRDPSTGTFAGDRSSDRALGDAELRALATNPGHPLTYTCVPTGSGRRTGIDRDEDGALDGDERDSGTDPADAASAPASCSSGPAIVKARLTVGANADPAGDELLGLTSALDLDGAAIDPATDGLGITLTDATGALVFARVVPPGGAATRKSAGWTVDRRGRRWTFRDAGDVLARGIRKVVLRRAARGRWKLALKGAGRFQVRTDRTPVRLVVALTAAPADDAGRCATRDFAAAACRSSRRGAKLVCR